MGKPGSLDIFNYGPLSIDRWCEHMHNEIEAFRKNMHNLKMRDMTGFEWFYTLGFWNEALEFRDEFPERFEEFRNKQN